MDVKTIDPELIKKRMSLSYQYDRANPANERLDCVQSLISALADQQLSMPEFLQSAADVIRDKFWVKEVTMGLRSRSDGLYRYEVMSGLSDTSWKAHRQLAYTLEQFEDPELYTSAQISNLTRLFLAEDNPYGKDEESTFDRELMLQSSRKSLDETIEGDYIDVKILGKGGTILGWIEISGTTDGKFPDVHTIKCLELLASVLGIALTFSET
ncbi:MAG: hypothetical protein LN411_03620 [Candidatus Thermoplasmatota archaeon]|nr:hypothetical protein [Candidatus Thermoplasmatota archaeon]